MAFGVLSTCKQCKMDSWHLEADGTTLTLFYAEAVSGYHCNGTLDDEGYERCGVVTNEPPRKAFKMPSHYKDSFSSYKYKKRVRVFREAAAVELANAKAAVASAAVPMDVSGAASEYAQHHKPPLTHSTATPKTVVWPSLALMSKLHLLDDFSRSLLTVSPK